MAGVGGTGPDAGEGALCGTGGMGTALGGLPADRPAEKGLAAGQPGLGCAWGCPDDGRDGGYG